jgi:hypothetical protein
MGTGQAAGTAAAIAAKTNCNVRDIDYHHLRKMLIEQNVFLPSN